jgi:hypothetical protein
MAAEMVVLAAEPQEEMVLLTIRVARRQVQAEHRRRVAAVMAMVHSRRQETHRDTDRILEWTPSPVLDAVTAQIAEAAAV